MSIRPTLQIGDPRLRTHNEEVKNFSDSQIKQIIKDLQETMADEKLIGMAAPQIGENVRIFVTEPRETTTRPADQSDIFRVYINPKIISFSDEENKIFEGCGSVLHGQLFGPVDRAKEITVEAFDENGRKFQLTCDGILARVIQHEVDHLNQEIFIEKVSDYKELLAVEFFREKAKKTPSLANAAHISKIKHTFIS